MSSRQNRETAYRVFAAEFDDATLSYAESDEERAPNYVLTPTGARINRLFAVGVLTETESVNDEQIRARIVDPTGAFVVYAGQYQPDALSFLERAEPPAFVAITGKARTFQPDDSNRVFTSIRPETLSEVDAATRDRSVVDTAEHTLERVRTMRDALARDERDDTLREALKEAGVEAGLADGIPRAIEHYGTTPAYLDALGELALDAARVVAGEREEAGSLDVAPDESAADRTAPAGAAETDVRTEPVTEAESRGSSGAGSDFETGTSVEADTDESADATTDSAEDTVVDPLETADEPAAETVESGQNAGEIEEGTAETATETTFDSEEFELGDEERERIEAEYGTGFESAAEVGEPGEADIETPAPEGETEPSAGETPTVEDTGAAESADEASDGETNSEEAVVTAMRDLDDGDGADREAVIERVVEEGLTREEAEEGIQSALLSGECYESDDDTLKPI